MARVAELRASAIRQSELAVDVTCNLAFRQSAPKHPISFGTGLRTSGQTVARTKYPAITRRSRLSST